MTATSIQSKSNYFSLIDAGKKLSSLSESLSHNASFCRSPRFCSAEFCGLFFCLFPAKERRTTLMHPVPRSHPSYTPSRTHTRYMPIYASLCVCVCVFQNKGPKILFVRRFFLANVTAKKCFGQLEPFFSCSTNECRRRLLVVPPSFRFSLSVTPI